MAVAGAVASIEDWPERLHRVLKDAQVRHMSYVPDAGHARLIELFHADPDVACTLLTSEEEGVAIAAGAWLGGSAACCSCSRAASATASTCCRCRCTPACRC